VRAFVCPRCHALLSYEDLLCVTCSTQVAYDRVRQTLVDLAGVSGCENREQIGCNWASAAGGGLCGCCLLTTVRPNDHDLAGVAAWALTETAKRRLVYQLDDLALTVAGVSFKLLSSREENVVTGHADGVITIDMAEGHDVHREAVRIGLGETYRTLLGHLRHEIGHWYWQVLVDGTRRQEPFRELFGDERRDYATALQEHYASDDDRGWSTTHVTRYAASHPWEDWAECFAHYLHIADALQTTASWRLRLGGPVTEPPVSQVGSLSAEPTDRVASFDQMIAQWLPLSFMLNAVNRSLGQSDAYPFLLAPSVLEKLRFVHAAVTADQA
jgi:hypothetical protein